LVSSHWRATPGPSRCCVDRRTDPLLVHCFGPGVSGRGEYMADRRLYSRRRRAQNCPAVSRHGCAHLFWPHLGPRRSPVLAPSDDRLGVHRLSVCGVDPRGHDQEDDEGGAVRTDQEGTRARLGGDTRTSPPLRNPSTNPESPCRRERRRLSSRGSPSSTAGWKTTKRPRRSNVTPPGVSGSAWSPNTGPALVSRPCAVTWPVRANDRAWRWPR
jgi:hypothetical protein